MKINDLNPEHILVNCDESHGESHGGCNFFVCIIGTITDGLRANLFITNSFLSSRFLRFNFHGLDN